MIRIRSNILVLRVGRDCLSNVGSAQPNITFLTMPMDMKATVGDMVNFTCEPLADGSPGIATWSVTDVDQNPIIVSNNTAVRGTTDSYVLGPNTNTMFLVNVSKILNRATVVCTGLDQGRTTIGVKAMPPATLLVLDLVPGEWNRFEITLGVEISAVYFACIFPPRPAP